MASQTMPMVVNHAIVIPVVHWRIPVMSSLVNVVVDPTSLDERAINPSRVIIQDISIY